MSGNPKQSAAGGPQTQRYSTPYPPVIASPSQRADGYQVTQPGTYVPQQSNQGANQGGLRSIPPSGPPNQASTPPNADIKVQSMSHPPMNQMFMQPPAAPRPTQQQFYPRPAGPSSQQPRMASQHNRHQIYQPPFMPMYATYNTPQYFYQTSAGPRPHNFTVQPVQMYQTAAGHASFNNPSQAPTLQSYYLNPPLFPSARPPPQQQAAAVPPNTAQATMTNIQIQQNNQHAPFQPPTQQQKPVIRRRPNALAIIDPTTGIDKLTEMYEEGNSHPPSGESSARQTPQPTPGAPQQPTPREVQVTFARQVAQQIDNDRPPSVEEHHPVAGGPLDHHLQHLDQMPPSAIHHVVDPHHHPDHSIYSNPPPPQPPAAQMRYDVAQSTLKIHAKEFVSASTLAAAKAKETTPIVSANCDAVEVTLPNKQPAKDRDSPVKGRKSRERTSESKETPPKEVGTQEKSVASTVKEEKKEPVPVVISAAPAAEKKEEKKQQQPTKKDVKAAPAAPETASPKVPSVETSETAAAPAPQAAVQPTQTAQDNSAKTKQNVSQKNVQQQNKQNQKSAPATVVPPPQPAKPNNKAHKKSELNLKGANKEGTDMDAFNDNAARQDDAVNANDVKDADIINANSVVNSNLPPVDNSNSVPVTTPVVAPPAPSKKPESNNETTTISKPVENKKKAFDLTDIVKEKPKKFVAPAAPPVDQDESNDKLVQVKNEANAKNAVNSETNDIRNELPYSDGQWAPSNPDGKKIYNREFLLALRDFPTSKIKPPNLPEAVIADNDRGRIPDRYGSMGGRDSNFQNSMFVPFPGGKGSRGPPPKRNSQSKMGSKNQKPGGRQQISISLQREEIKLNLTENAWRPAHLNSKGDTQTDDEKKTEALYKKVRGVLNKLTPQKFETLVNQVRSLEIDTESRLQGVIDLVFEKAVDEPNFSVAYALMCRELALMQVPAGGSTDEKKEVVNFRKLLITRCQMEFEKQSADESSRLEKVKEIEECTDPEKKKDLVFELEDHDRRLRMKSVGNIRFIGELFKQNMLTVKIMQGCLYNLLNLKEEESLECLCKLLSTIGKELESKDVQLNDIFHQLRGICEKGTVKVSSRVKFMLKDVIDLRSSKWVPRRTDLNPKTIDQIQKEAEHEQMKIQVMNSVPITPRKDDRGSNNGPNSDRKGRRNVSSDGWETAQTSRSRTPFTVQSDKLKVKPPQMHELSLGSGHLFSQWGKGSNVKAPQNTMLPPTNNMYAALEPEQQLDNRSTGPRQNNKDPYSSKGHSLERGGGYNNRMGGGSGYDSRGGAGSRSGSQHRSNDRSTSAAHRSTPNPMPPPAMVPAPAAPVAPKPKEPTVAPVEALTEEQLERRVKNSLDEYLNDNTTADEYDQEVRNCVPASYWSRVVGDGYLHVLEKSKVARKKTGKLFAKLINLGTLPLDEYCKGVDELFESAEDLIIDIPMFFTYLADTLIDLLNEEALPLTRLNKLMDSLSAKNRSKLIEPLFKMVIAEKGENFLQSIWQISQLKMSEFLLEQDVDAFVKNNKFEFLLSDRALTPEEFHSKLKEFFLSKTTFDGVKKWISANVGERIKENAFIRALATAIFENSMQRKKLNSETLTNHLNLLLLYVDNQPNYELQCLFALQTLVNKMEHPQGLLLEICNHLYEQGSFSQECFIQWEENKDPAEAEGKGVALKQLTSFFTQLRENDDEESDCTGED